MKNTPLDYRIEKTKQKLKELEAKLKELEAKKRLESKVIKEGDRVFGLYGNGQIDKMTFEDTPIHQSFLRRGFISKNKEDLEKLDLRLQSMAQRGEEPEEDEAIWTWDFYHGEPYEALYGQGRRLQYMIGCAKRTEEEVQEWADKYLRGWI